MGPLDVEAGGNNISADAIAAGTVEASHDVTKLRRVLVAGGVGQAATALYLALFKPPAGLFLRSASLSRTYYGVLAAVVLFGVAEAWVGLWVSHDPPRGRTVAMKVLWASVLVLLLLAGAGGFAAQK